MIGVVSIFIWIGIPVIICSVCGIDNLFVQFFLAGVSGVIAFVFYGACNAARIAHLQENSVFTQRDIAMEPLIPPASAAPDGSSFEQAIVLDGAILGFAAIVEHEYLNEHYPGCKVQRQVLREHAGRSYDIIEFLTADGNSERLYFALSKFPTA